MAPPLCLKSNRNERISNGPPPTDKLKAYKRQHKQAIITPILAKTTASYEHDYTISDASLRRVSLPHCKERKVLDGKDSKIKE